MFTSQFDPERRQTIKDKSPQPKRKDTDFNSRREHTIVEQDSIASPRNFQKHGESLAVADPEPSVTQASIVASEKKIEEVAERLNKDLSENQTYENLSVPD